MRETIDLVVLEEQRKTGGISLAVAVSLLVHSLLAVWFIRAYRPLARPAADVPIARYVDLVKQNPREFVEAPGAKVDRAPVNAPLSDANRRAAMPEPTGDQPTLRPGDGGSIYTPPVPQGSQRPSQQGRPAVQQDASRPGAQASGQDAAAQPPEGLVFREESASSRQRGTGAVDWKSAIREAGKAASLGGSGFDLGAAGAGEKGFAEAGPLSFETQWYDWGEYAQSMVSRIRVNWYANMPQIIRTGIRGASTIRFTIHRDGRISDIEIVQSSGVPPYDFAARKAIELSSPLNPLPRDFPNPSERVTAIFYYNMEIPTRG